MHAVPRRKLLPRQLHADHVHDRGILLPRRHVGPDRMHTAELLPCRRDGPDPVPRGLVLPHAGHAHRMHGRRQLLPGQHHGAIGVQRLRSRDVHRVGVHGFYARCVHTVHGGDVVLNPLKRRRLLDLQHLQRGDAHFYGVHDHFRRQLLALWYRILQQRP